MKKEWISSHSEYSVWSKNYWAQTKLTQLIDVEKLWSLILSMTIGCVQERITIKKSKCMKTIQNIQITRTSKDSLVFLTHYNIGYTYNYLFFSLTCVS